ncbi:putative Acyl-CoA dehydrogenase [Diplonema papillatum]|nr:putative Acyl-CoA dehydrogenase [Diplonema papillatum]
MSKGVVSMEEVAKHNSPGDMWIVVDDQVYNVSKFAAMHPGGERVIKLFAGKDATEEFYELHRKEVLAKYQRLVVGRVEKKMAAEESLFSPVPYGELMVCQRYKSPYFTDDHLAMKTRYREYYSAFIPECTTLDNAGKYPPLELNKKLAKDGNFAACLGPGPWLKGLTVCGIPGEKFDVFHEVVFLQEFTRLSSQGFADGLAGGLTIGLPPVVHFGTKQVSQRVMEEVVSGEKRICLAISEPYVGSDVAQIRCEAKKSSCGKYYIVNGEKKWITGGVFADYFTTAVRTGGKGMGGISLLLIPRTEGVTTKQIYTSYSPSAGTAYVMFQDVKVPVENLIGKENAGFACIMSNFNHERWGMIVGLAERCRIMVDECFKWAMQRKVFGKPLMSLPVIRFKLAEMAAASESLEHWLEAVTYQIHTLSPKDQAKRLAGPIGLLKYHSTRVSMKIADNASQIFGGRALTKSGMGYKAEQFMRNVKFSAILGGSEEVMADLAVRQATKFIPSSTKL